MNTMRVVKKINSNDIHIVGLDKYRGMNAEILILIEEGQKGDVQSRRKRAHQLIESFSGKIKK